MKQFPINVVEGEHRTPVGQQIQSGPRSVPTVPQHERWHVVGLQFQIHPPFTIFAEQSQRSSFLGSNDQRSSSIAGVVRENQGRMFAVPQRQTGAGFTCLVDDRQTCRRQGEPRPDLSRHDRGIE